MLGDIGSLIFISVLMERALIISDKIAAKADDSLMSKKDMSYWQRDDELSWVTHFNNFENIF
jgi:hypothetical protein